MWSVDPDGNGTLAATKTGAFYVALEAIGTMSIRVQGTGALQACGRVTPADESACPCPE